MGGQMLLNMITWTQIIRLYNQMKESNLYDKRKYNNEKKLFSDNTK